MTRFFSRIFCFCFILSFWFPFALAAQSEWPLPGEFSGDKITESEGRGLVVRSSPSGAKVFIDGIERGRTPLRLTDLREGTYFVRVERDGYSERRFQASVRSGSALEVQVELKHASGRALIRVQAAGDDPAQDLLSLEPLISVDGNLSPASPVFNSGGAGWELRAELPTGYRTILVRAFGWDDILRTVYIEDDSLQELDFYLTPAPFRISGASLSRRRFNPANSGSLGTTNLNFEVSAPGKGDFIVLDREGKAVYSRSLDPFTSWSQSLTWDGRNNQGEILSDGVYTLAVRAVSFPSEDSVPTEESPALDVVLDSSRIIFPLALSSGKSGLLFAPLPFLLPPGSFQIEGSVLAGVPPESDGLWKSYPFSAAFRFSPLDRLEVSAALNVMLHIEKSAEAGFAGGVKWVFVNPHSRKDFFGAAAGLTVSWTGKTALSPFGMASGIEIFFPLSLNMGKFFSFSLSPAALWTGDEGFPWEPAPRLLVSGGVMMKLNYLSAGLSVRSEYKFTGGGPLRPAVMAGAEAKFFPPPSSFVFSFMGGVWARDSRFGGFGGIGIGMIY